MALSIDSRSLLRALADHTDAFPDIQVELAEALRKLLVKQLKAKTVNLSLFKKIYHSIGETNISTVLDNYSESELAALLKKLDPFSSLLKSKDAKLLRSHVTDIATERAQPSDKPQKTSAAKQPRSSPKEPPPKIGNILDSKVHSGKARPKRAKKLGA